MRLLTAVAALAIIGLAPAPAAAQAPAPPLPSVPLVPELERVLRDYERLWRAGDAAGLAALFTEDGFVLRSGHPPVRGRPAIHSVYKDAGGALRLRALATATEGSVGWIIGAYGYEDAGSRDVGKFILALRRDDGGRWLIAADMDNGNQQRRPAP